MSATSTSAARCRRALHKHITHRTKTHSAGKADMWLMNFSQHLQTPADPGQGLQTLGRAGKLAREAMAAAGGLPGGCRRQSAMSQAVHDARASLRHSTERTLSELAHGECGVSFALAAVPARKGGGRSSALPEHWRRHPRQRPRTAHAPRRAHPVLTRKGCRGALVDPDAADCPGPPAKVQWCVPGPRVHAVHAAPCTSCDEIRGREASQCSPTWPRPAGSLSSLVKVLTTEITESRRGAHWHTAPAVRGSLGLPTRSPTRSPRGMFSLLAMPAVASRSILAGAVAAAVAADYDGVSPPRCDPEHSAGQAWALIATDMVRCAKNDSKPCSSDCSREKTWLTSAGGVLGHTLCANTSGSFFFGKKEPEVFAHDAAAPRSVKVYGVQCVVPGQPQLGREGTIHPGQGATAKQEELEGGAGAGGRVRGSVEGVGGGGGGGGGISSSGGISGIGGGRGEGQRGDEDDIRSARFDLLKEEPRRRWKDMVSFDELKAQALRPSKHDEWADSMTIVSEEEQRILKILRNLNSLISSLREYNQQVVEAGSQGSIDTESCNNEGFANMTKLCDDLEITVTVYFSLSEHRAGIDEKPALRPKTGKWEMPVSKLMTRGTKNQPYRTPDGHAFLSIYRARTHQTDTRCFQTHARA